MNIFGIIKGKEHWFIGPIFSLAIFAQFGEWICKYFNIQNQSISYHLFMTPIMLFFTLLLYFVFHYLIKIVLKLLCLLWKPKDQYDWKNVRSDFDLFFSCLTVILIFFGIAGFFKDNKYIPFKEWNILWNYGFLLSGIFLLANREEHVEE